METLRLYKNGSVLTMDENGCCEALLTRGGLIAGVGTLAQMRALAGGPCEEIDLAGGALLPGFIDGHSHFAQFAGSLCTAALTACRSLDDVVRTLRDFAAETALPADAWIIGFGYDHNALAEHRHPDRTVLDAVSDTRCVLISHASGHMGCLNSAALAALGITAATPDPQGGHIGRGADGAPNGYLEENAFMQAAQRAPRPDTAQMLRAMRRAQDIYFSYGITTAQEGLLKEPEDALLRGMAAAGELQLDVVGYADIAHCPQLAESAPHWTPADTAADVPAPPAYEGHYRVGGYKLFLDGSPQGRTAWLSQPYTPEAGQSADYRGYPVWPDEDVRRFVSRAAAEGRQLLTHCNGDAAAQQLLDAHAFVQELRGGVPGIASRRNVIIHAQLLRVQQLPEVAALGLMPSYFVAHTYYWGDVHLKNLGARRAGHISPVASTARLGIPYTFHMDTPVLRPDALMCMQCAVLRRTRAGVPLAESEAVPVAEALRGVTVNGAYQYFEERAKGTLAPGKAADLVQLAENPLTADPERLAQIAVVRTMKGGETVYSAV